MKKRISLNDVAKHLGVSTALVSYVLNNKAEEKRVGKDIAERIRIAAEELNYRPNHIAKSLKTNKTHTIGLVVADIKYHFTTVITHAIEAEAKKNNYTVIFGSSHEDSIKFDELVGVFIDRQVDGLILIAVEGSEQQIKNLIKSEIPFVLVDRYFPDINTNHILLNNYKAAYNCVDYLAKKGFKNIGFINYKTSLFHLQERNRGYAAALRDNNLPTNPGWEKVIRENYLMEDISTSIQELTSAPLSCDAIFFATDTLAVNGLKYINHLKLKVPEDIGVISFDSAEAFELFNCTITHAKQPMDNMGKMAVSTLMDIMDNRNVNRQVFLESEIVEGESCGE